MEATGHSIQKGNTVDANEGIGEVVSLPWVNPDVCLAAVNNNALSLGHLHEIDLIQ
jgi:hypothetical protein